jgi:F420-0:gamma-glutamyl ligase-like protein
MSCLLGSFDGIRKGGLELIDSGTHDIDGDVVFHSEKLHAHGLANGLFLDDRRFDPIWERAQALDVPIYLHPPVIVQPA